MKAYKGEQIRNIGLAAHGGAGKTSLAEAMLYTMGVTTRLGAIDQGNTVSDYNEDEIERQISISASLLHGEWKKNKINIIDTPGYSDFFGEVVSGLSVVENTTIIISAASGIEVGTEQAFDISKKYNQSVSFVVNKLDRENVDFDKMVAEIREVFGTAAAAVQFPAETGPNFSKVIDVLTMKQFSYATDDSGKVTVEDIPADLMGKAEEMRSQLVESIAESDDELLEKFFEAGELTDEEFNNGFKNAFSGRKFFPIFATSATKNVGVGGVLDFVLNYVPNPLERGSITSDDGEERKSGDDEPVTAFVFKTVSEAHVGELSCVRLFSGVLKSGDETSNPNQNHSERIGQIFSLSGKNKENLDELHAGDIGALVKLKSTHTGDTLVNKGASFCIPRLAFPESLMTVAVEPKSKGDESKVSQGFQSLHEEDPTFSIVMDPELKQTVISGQGELHLTIIVKRLKQKFGVEVNMKDPKIPYRETIKGRAEARYRHKKQSGGAGQFAEVLLRVEPKPRGEGIEFVNSLVGQNVDRVYVPSVEKGVTFACRDGIIAGYKVVDLKVDFFDGKMHPVDSSDIAFQIAGRSAFKEAFMSSKPVLLEPIFDLEVRVPEEYMGDVMGDISSRRGKIQGMDAEGRKQVIKAKVPLSELYKYATSLRSMTQGRGLFTQRLSHYEEVPGDVAQKIIAESKEED